MYAAADEIVVPSSSEIRCDQGPMREKCIIYCGEVGHTVHNFVYLEEMQPQVDVFLAYEEDWDVEPPANVVAEHINVVMAAEAQAPPVIDDPEPPEVEEIPPELVEPVVDQGENEHQGKQAQAAFDPAEVDRLRLQDVHNEAIMNLIT